MREQMDNWRILSSGWIDNVHIVIFFHIILITKKSANNICVNLWNIALLIMCLCSAQSTKIIWCFTELVLGWWIGLQWQKSSSDHLRLFKLNQPERLNHWTQFLYELHNNCTGFENLKFVPDLLKLLCKSAIIALASTKRWWA